MVTGLRVELVQIPFALEPDVESVPLLIIVSAADVAFVDSTWIASAFPPPVVIVPLLVTELPPAFERPFAPKDIP